MNEPLVSIVICNYNQEHFVVGCVESALKQTYSNCEVIVVDNGSTDRSPVLLQKYSDHPKIKLLLNKENAPVTVRLNQGIQASSGDFISILYADDYYLPHKIESQMDAFSKLGSEYGVVYTPGERLNVLTGELFPTLSMKRSGSILREMLTRYHQEGFIDPVSPLVRRQCFHKYPFNENVFIEGEGIFFRIAIDWKFHYLDRVGSVMRDHLGNAGKAIKKTKTYEVQIITHLLSLPQFPHALRGEAKNYLARVLRNYGWQALRISGDKPWARACFREALQWSPKQALHPRTVVGTCLSFIPDTLLRTLNGLASRLLNRPGILHLKETNV